MRVARLESEIDFDGWRAAARALRAEGVKPEAVVWTVERDLFSQGLFPPPSQNPFPPHEGEGKILTVPVAFVDLAQTVILHRSPERLALLYRILHRLERQPRLLDNPADADVAKARDMAKGVGRAIHKMHAFVRFRLVEEVTPETYVAWFEPAHRVTEAAAPFFARRFANMNWSILTPDACVHWDRGSLTMSPGADPADAPSQDAQEEMWRTYYASIFNPARLNPAMMKQEMPKRYWRNLPEAALIPELIAKAQGRTETMVAAQPSKPSDRVLKAALKHARDGAFGESNLVNLEEVAAGVQVCRRCDLWRDATQGVPGGPRESSADDRRRTARRPGGPAGRSRSSARPANFSTAPWPRRACRATGCLSPTPSSTSSTSRAASAGCTRPPTVERSRPAAGGWTPSGDWLGPR
jgi:probable DNA metabolism protein